MSDTPAVAWVDKLVELPQKKNTPEATLSTLCLLMALPMPSDLVPEVPRPIPAKRPTTFPIALYVARLFSLPLVPFVNLISQC